MCVRRRGAFLPPSPRSLHLERLRRHRHQRRDAYVGPGQHQAGRAKVQVDRLGVLELDAGDLDGRLLLDAGGRRGDGEPGRRRRRGLPLCAGRVAGHRDLGHRSPQARRGLKGLEGRDDNVVQHCLDPPRVAHALGVRVGLVGGARRVAGRLVSDQVLRAVEEGDVGHAAAIKIGGLGGRGLPVDVAGVELEDECLLDVLILDGFLEDAVRVLDDFRGDRARAFGVELVEILRHPQNVFLFCVH